MVQSTEAEVTNFCLGDRYVSVPFTVTTSPMSIPREPTGIYELSVSLEGVKTLKQVRLP